jgi:hypothetical protein
MQPRNRGLARELDDRVVDGSNEELGDPIVDNTTSVATEELGPALVPAPGPLMAKLKAKKRKHKATTTKDKVGSSLPTAKHPKHLKGKAKVVPKSTQVIKSEDKPDSNGMDVDPGLTGKGKDKAKGKAKATPKSGKLVESEDEPDGDGMDVDPTEAGLSLMDVYSLAGLFVKCATVDWD